MKYGFPQHVTIGNECADALARRGAALCGSMAGEKALEQLELKASFVRARILRIQKWILTNQGPEKDGRGEERRKKAKESRAAKRELSELQREERHEDQQPQHWELEVLPEELEVLPEEPPALSPQQAQWARVVQRIHPSHSRFLATDTHWVCTRCGAQAAKEGRLRLALLAGPCKAPTPAAKSKLKKLHRVWA